MGLVGLLTYVVAAIQDTLSGYLIDASKIVSGGETTYSFRLVFTAWIGALVLSTLCTVALWIYTRVRKTRAEGGPA